MFSLLANVCALDIVSRPGELVGEEARISELDVTHI